MTPNAEAAQLASQYSLILKFAASKASLKWRSFLAAIPESVRPFDHADINQWALEGLLTLARIIDAPFFGTLTLTELEAGRDSERRIQHAVDLFISSRTQEATRQFRAEKRGGGKAPVYLDAPADDDGRTLGDELGGTLGTSETAIPNVAKRYPLSWQIDVLGRNRRDVMAAMGLTDHGYKVAKRRELNQLTAWAIRNKRLISAA